MSIPFGAHIPFVDHLGFTLEKFEGGESELHFVPRPEHFNSFNVAHGGAVMTFLDVIDHLLALAKFIDELLVGSERAHASDPITMVVLDDEADDASVLDAEDSGKVTPKFIEMLWSRGQSKPLSAHKNVFAAYVAYTATPQANFLQHAHNPLAPRDFFAALRTPGDTGTISPRCISYIEPGGLSGYYTGGDFYYDRFYGLAADQFFQ